MYKQIAKSFKANVESVFDLAEFDHLVMETVLRQLSQLNERLREDHGIGNPRLTAQKTYDHLKNIRENDSLRPKYEHMFNQCVVLLVSYFGSAVADLFRVGVTTTLTKNPSKMLLKEELTVSIQDLAEFSDVKDRVGDLLIQKRNISFQDMQSIFRTFRDFLDIEIPRNEIVNDIIVGQASRHVVVHNDAISTERFQHQIRDAEPRVLKPSIAVGDVIRFSPDEVRQLGSSMIEYVESLAGRLSAAA